MTRSIYFQTKFIWNFGWCFLQLGITFFDTWDLIWSILQKCAVYFEHFHQNYAKSKEFPRPCFLRFLCHLDFLPFPSVFGTTQKIRLHSFNCILFEVPYSKFAPEVSFFYSVWIILVLLKTNFLEKYWQKYLIGIHQLGTSHRTLSDNFHQTFLGFYWSYLVDIDQWPCWRCLLSWQVLF